MKLFTNMQKKIERFTILSIILVFPLYQTACIAQLKVETVKKEKKYEVAEISIEYPVFSGAKSATKINKILKEEAIGNPDKYLEDFINSYKELVNDIGKENVYGYYEKSTYDITLNDKNLLSIGFVFENYLGGAHGLYGIGYFVFDSKTGDTLTVKDLFSAGYEQKLKIEMEKSLRKEMNIPADMTLNDYGYWFENGEITITNNFYLNDKGIGFFYNPYEIAAYVMGSSDIFIPYEKMSEYIPQKGYLAPYLK